MLTEVPLDKASFQVPLSKCSLSAKTSPLKSAIQLFLEDPPIHWPVAQSVSSANWGKDVDDKMAPIIQNNNECLFIKFLVI